MDSNNNNRIFMIIDKLGKPDRVKVSGNLEILQYTNKPTNWFFHHEKADYDVVLKSERLSNTVDRDSEQKFRCSVSHTTP